MLALPLRRPAVPAFDVTSRQTLVVEPGMAGMLVLLPEEQLLASHERADGMIELVIGPRPRRRATIWPWVALALAGTTLGGLLAQAALMLAG